MYLSAIDRNEGPLLQIGVSESVISGNVDLVDASSTFGTETFNILCHSSSCEGSPPHDIGGS